MTITNNSDPDIEKKNQCFSSLWRTDFTHLESKLKIQLSSEHEDTIIYQKGNPEYEAYQIVRHSPPKLRRNFWLASFFLLKFKTCNEKQT
jgi:hypothetical protein